VINWQQTVISQYSNSTQFLALLESLNEWIDPNQNFENFYTLVWNVLNPDEDVTSDAYTYGLNVWGRIVNIGRTLPLESGGPYFGFGEAGDRVGFGQGPFWGGPTITTNYTLSNPDYRRLILAKAAFNITNGSIPAINQILLNLFPGRGNAYVTDGANGPIGIWFGFGEAGDRVGFGQGPFGDNRVGAANMTLTYVFDFPLQPFEVAMVLSGVLPKPTGVKAFWSYTEG
jgi:hypothetical protein